MVALNIWQGPDTLNHINSVMIAEVFGLLILCTSHRSVLRPTFSPSAVGHVCGHTSHLDFAAVASPVNVALNSVNANLIRNLDALQHTPRIGPTKGFHR